MKRLAAVLYGFLAYLAFLLPVGYLVGFLADFGVPKTVDRGAGAPGPALAVDLALLLAFGLQHSVMARPGFKVAVERWIPRSMERSTYVLASGLTLVLVYGLWRPVPAVLWDVSGTPWEPLAWTGYAVGWGVAVWATFALSHLHLFGVSQVAAWVRGRPHPRMVLRDTVLYRIVRHPMTAGLLLAFWSTPRMTLGHFVFAAGMTAYCLVATALEERDLLRSFPESYRAYRRRVPALVPLLRPGRLLSGRHGFAIELTVLAAMLGLVALATLRGLGPATVSAEPSSRLERDAIDVDGHRRSYALYDPGSPGPRPLVVALHGTGGRADRLHAFLGGELERVADANEWLVVYPEAVGSWNDCRRAVGGAMGAGALDDVAFVRELVARLARERGADPGRVFVLGFSGGGHMAFRLAFEAPERVAAVAVFAASLPTEGELACDVPNEVPPMMLVNGSADLVSPVHGGDVITPDGRMLGTVRSAAETARVLRTRVRRQGEVHLVVLPRGGHTVPGSESRFPALAGRTDRTFEGVDEAAVFFLRQSTHEQGRSRPGPRGTLPAW
jgi:methanethiol S-methyltransferase